MTAAAQSADTQHWTCDDEDDSDGDDEDGDDEDDDGDEGQKPFEGFYSNRLIFY